MGHFMNAIHCLFWKTEQWLESRVLVTEFLETGISTALSRSLIPKTDFSI